MKKINIAELLKDCPKGMELDCTMYDGVTLFSVDDKEEIVFPIKGTTRDGLFITLTKYGQFISANSAKCVIFPKGKTTWEGFVPPCKFKDGDVVVDTLGGIHIMRNSSTSYCHFDRLRILVKTETSCVKVDRLATEEEKQKLFDAIKANGYKWNLETKTLDKLEVNKFDITTLKPFESRVLVRSSMDGLWKPAVFGFRNGYNDNAFYIVGGSCWKQCIPYLNNEYLCGTTNDCDEYFKTWE